jgi:hypothetical protein
MYLFQGGPLTLKMNFPNELSSFLLELRLLIRKHKPTIVGITEVKPKDFRYDIEDAYIALDGYDMLGCNLHNKTGRGFLIKSLSSATLFVKQSAFVYVQLIVSNLCNERLTKSNLCDELLTNLCSFHVQANPVEFSSKFQESVWISVKLVGGDELLVGCIYRSNSGTNENNECLLKLLNEVNDAKYSHVLIMGDFNFEKINWNTWSTSSPETYCR